MTRRARLILSLFFIASAPTIGKAAPTSVAHARSGALACVHAAKPAGTVTYSDWQFPDTLNPYQTGLQVTSEVLPGLFAGLFRYDSRGRVIPMLASAVPTFKNGGIRDGGRLITIHLRHGTRWSNGAEITSRDVRFGWQVDMDLATGPSCAGSCDVISRVDTPDRYTAVLHLRQVDAPAVPNAMPNLWPVSWPGAWNNDPHAAAARLGQDVSFNFESAKFPTNGAYQVQQFVNNSRIVLRPMKYYTLAGCGRPLANLTFSFYSSKATMISAAVSHKTDVTQGYSLADLLDLQKHPRAYRLHVDPSFIVEHIELNVDPKYKGKPNPLASTDVRLALALAIDRTGLIEGSAGVGRKIAQQYVAWTFLVNTPTLVQPFADRRLTGQWDPLRRAYVVPGTAQAIADAQKLLARAGFRGGHFSVDFFTTAQNGLRAAQEAVVASSWAKLGVKLVPNFLPASKLFAGWSGGTTAHGAFQALMFAYLGAPDPDGFKFNLTSRYIDRFARVHSSLNGNNSGIRDPLIDRDFSLAARTYNSGLRARYYNVIQVQMNQKAYWIPLYFRPSIATDDGRLANFSNSPNPSGPEWNMYAWRLR